MFCKCKTFSKKRRRQIERQDALVLKASADPSVVADPSVAAPIDGREEATKAC